MSAAVSSAERIAASVPDEIPAELPAEATEPSAVAAPLTSADGAGLRLRGVSARWPGAAGEGWPSWAFENHDAPRALSRWCKPQHREAFARLKMLLLVALQLLTGLGNAGKPTAADDVNVALVPLGTPLLAGPGAIAAVIVGVSGVDAGSGGYLAIAAAIVSVHLVVMLVLRYSTALIRLLGIGGITLLAKIAGLLLAAIAVQLIADSVMGFIAEGA